MSNPDTSAVELRDKVAEMLAGDYACTRVWEAWQVGTMTEDDFEPLSETERVDEFADFITSYIKQRELALLERLEEQKIYGHLAVPDCTHFVPLSAIQKEKEKLV